MENISKNVSIKIFIIFFMFAIALTISHILLEKNFVGSHIKEVTLENGLNKANEKEKNFKAFLRKSDDVLSAISKSYSFNLFLNNQKSDIAELFLNISMANNDFLKLRYIDKDGKERLRIDKDNISSTPIFVQKLEDISKDDFFISAKEKPLNKVFFSNISLENNKSTIKAILPISNKNNFNGILVIDYDLDSFLDEFIYSTLYNLILIDKNGHIIKHFDNKNSWSKYQKEPFTIKSIYGILSTDILKDETFISLDFVSKKLDLDIPNKLILIVQISKTHLQEHNDIENQNLFVTAFFVFLFSIISGLFIINIIKSLYEKYYKIEEMNLSLNKKNDELNSAYDMVKLQAQKLEEANLELEASYVELSMSNKMYEFEKSKYKSIIDLASDAIVILDMNGNIVEYSTSFSKLLGYEKNEISNLNILEWNITLNQKNVKDYLSSHTNIKQTYSTQYKRKDNTIIDVETNAKMIEIDNKSYIYKSVRDITEHKKYQQTILEQKREFETIFEASIDAIAIVDKETNFVKVNNAFVKMSGYTKEELLSHSCLELTIEEEKDRTIKALMSAYENNSIQNFEKTCIKKDGTHMILNISISSMPDRQNFVLSIREVTQEREKNWIIKEYINQIDKNIITSTTDLDGNITYVSKAFCDISGYTKDELIGKNHRIVRDEHTPISLYKQMWDNISNNKSWNGEIQNKKKDGTTFWASINISPIYDFRGQKRGYTAILEDITDKKYIQMIAITDGLTNIYNRRYFNDIAPKILNNAQREDTLIAFILMDIDYFKQYNDTYGHQMGDEVLIKVANTIQKSIKRVNDFCFRLGGEEFGVLITIKDKNDARRLANEINANIKALQIEHINSKVNKVITISSGLVCKRAKEFSNIESMYHSADTLLYRAKEEGRDRICVEI